ncbi:MAG TPA: hypothetical protein VGV59_21640 [Pyrinomonadaceae bacterium]|nr:hypothetical protein [Pyrinomonadaceae bacterium]
MPNELARRINALVRRINGYVLNRPFLNGRGFQRVCEMPHYFTDRAGGLSHHLKYLTDCIPAGELSFALKLALFVAGAASGGAALVNAASLLPSALLLGAAGHTPDGGLITSNGDAQFVQASEVSAEALPDVFRLPVIDQLAVMIDVIDALNVIVAIGGGGAQSLSRPQSGLACGGGGGA